ncbi:MAG: aspartate kinase [Bacteroidetes bacterium]|nr:MAG: aspartate kinase [Bacteroidota bacterium]
MKILKFGGTSVGSATRMKGVQKLISTPEPKIVVLSAMSGTTNSLVEIGKALYEKDKNKALQLIEKLENHYKITISDLYETTASKNKGEKLLDEHFGFMRTLANSSFGSTKERELLAEGEILSTHLVQFYLEELNIESVLLDALDFMLIDADNEPVLNFISEKLKKQMAFYPSCKLFITQGYICRNALGEVDNLKRGGSDYTASLVGAAIMSEEIQIWTDIDGMHNNDPRIVDKTVRIDEISFDEAAELAYFGAKILHPSSVLPAKLKNIPVRLLNTMEPDAKGTLITEKPKIFEEGKVKAIAAKDGIISIRIESTRMFLAYGFLRKLFEVFERYKKPIDMITTSEVGVAVTIENDTDLDKIVSELQKFSTVKVERDMSIVCIVGDLMADTSGYAKQIFSPLEHIPIRMISYGGSKNNASILVKTSDKVEVLRVLNKALFGL